MTLESILGAAVGSIITIILTKLLEVWQKTRDHKFELKKIFFEKKLAAAEEAVSMWYSMSTSYSALSALYEQMAKLEGKITGQLFESFNNNYFAQLNKLIETSSQLANKAYLYFDFETDTTKAGESLKTIFEAIGEIQDIALSVDALKHIKRETSNDPISQVLVDEETQKLLRQSKDHINSIKSIFDKVQVDINRMLITMRTQMKQFE